MSAANLTSRSAGRGAGRLQTIVIIAIAAVIVGILGYSALGIGQTDGVTKVSLPEGAAGAAPATGQVAPDFSAVTWDGKPVSLSQFKGQPVWLTFGASWCPDCRTEAADVEATYKANQAGGLAVLAVFISEPATDVASYAQKAGLTFPIAVDQQEQIASAYRTMGIPTHYFIGRDGTIRSVRIGALSKDDMAAAVAAIMN
jgi:cytochrome c biogenesis protein CcmG, thiol:disulfide interchange protein DsbE